MVGAEKVGGVSVLHGPGGRTQQPQPCLRSGGADVVRASKLRHAAERTDGDVHLGRPTVIGAQAQSVPNHPFEPADCGFGSRPRRVAGRLLPGHVAVLGDLLQVAVALRGRSCSRFQPRSGWNGSGGAVSAVSLGTAVARGGTMTGASGWRLATPA